MSEQSRLAQVFVELADTLVAGFDVMEFLQVLVERCVELLDVDAAGLMLGDHRGTLQAMTSSIASVHSLELFELQHDQGPCLDCFSTGQRITNVDLSEAKQRWPTFTAAALTAGFGTCHALPMRLRDQVIGAVNLFQAGTGQLSAPDIELGQAMADIATIGLLHERAVRERDVLATQLQGALDSRVVIEQAKGVVAERVGISVLDAFQLMRQHARSTSRPLSGVAIGVIDGSVDTRVMQSS